MLNYTLGTIEASEALIKDLYIDLRTKVNAWSEITQQTPQARMGYIGQHLVSVVTGYPGGKSGARGYDLIIDQAAHEYGEIKTCYRIDQLGKCKSCSAVVSSLESSCSECGSTEIERKDDSKWLIPIRNDSEFGKILEPKKYYFVLFEYENMCDTANSNIVSSIWEVDPKTKGFGFCMTDYYFNIKNNAPFNMWPYSIKFLLTNPKLIYRSKILVSGKIVTDVFPTYGNTVIDEIKPLNNYLKSKTITTAILKSFIKKNISNIKISNKNKSQLLDIVEKYRIDKKIQNAEFCEMLAEEIYLPKIIEHKSKIPNEVKKHFPGLT